MIFFNLSLKYLNTYFTVLFHCIHISFPYSHVSYFTYFTVCNLFGYLFITICRSCIIEPFINMGSIIYEISNYLNLIQKVILTCEEYILVFFGNKRIISSLSYILFRKLSFHLQTSVISALFSSFETNSQFN